MTAPLIHGKRPVFSASKVLDAVAETLSAIKSDDKLTWGDVGRVLGKSDDQAAKYASGEAEMGIVAFAAAKREWNGRFTGVLDRLCHDSRPIADTDHGRHCKVLMAALALAEALRADGSISPDQVRGSRAALEDARDAITDLLGTLTPRGMTG